MTPAPVSSASQRTGSPFSSTRRRFLQITGLGLGAAALGVGVTACGTAQTGSTSDDSTAKGRSGAAGETLFVFVASGVPTNFNPLGASPAWPTANGQSQLIYETLLRFNLLDGTLQPGLAKELQEPEPGVLVLPLQDGTTWSDGTDLTADDVVFTFELAEKVALGYSNVWTYLESVEAIDQRTVRFTVKKKPYNPGSVKDAIAGTFIVPKHVWEPVDPEEILKETNLEPVGSGPFTLERYDQTQINLARFDDYWGKEIFGTPAMTTINHPIFKSNNDSDLKLESGELDAAQTFTSQIWKMWEKGAPVGTWLKEKPYYLPGNLPLLEINAHVKGLDNAGVRRAIAHCIDYAVIASTAMSDYSDPAKASLILPTGAESKYFDQASVDQEGWTHDPDKAIDILENELEVHQGLRRHLLAARRHPARAVEGDHTDRLDRLEHRARGRGQVLQGGRHRRHDRVPAGTPGHHRHPERRLRAGVLERVRGEHRQPVDPVPRCARRPRRRADRQDGLRQLHPVLPSRRGRAAGRDRLGSIRRGAQGDLHEARHHLPRGHPGRAR